MTAVILPLPAYTDSSGSCAPTLSLPKILTGPVPQSNEEANSNDSQLVVLNLAPENYFRVPYVRALLNTEEIQRIAIYSSFKGFFFGFLFSLACVPPGAVEDYIACWSLPRAC